MKLAAIDIGSNSIHMIIVEVAPDGSFQVMDRVKEMIGLGRGTLERNHLDERTMTLGAATLGKCLKLAQRHGVEEVLAVATSAVREALNGGDFIETVRRDTGIDVRVVTAVEEARLIGLAVREGIDLHDSRALVIDIGGGSIEMIRLDQGKIVTADSFKLGVIRLAERFLPEGDRLARSGRRELVDYVRAVSGEFVERARAEGIDQVIGTSGTILTLGAMAADLKPDAEEAEQLNGRSVGVDAIKAVRDRLLEMNARERARIPGIDERRADTIAVGAVALCAILEDLGADELTMCDRALREGIVADYLERNRARLGRLEALPNLRRRSVIEFAERYGYDARHAAHVGRMALQLFDRTRSFHELGDEYREFLEYGAALHDVGTYIAFPGHHRHGYYLVKNGGLRGFRPDEVEFLGGLVLYHRRRNPRPTDLCLRALDKKQVRALKVLAGILRVADGLDRSHFQVVSALGVRVTGRTVSLYVDAGEDPELEVWAAKKKGRLLEKALDIELRLTLKGGGAKVLHHPAAAPADLATADPEAVAGPPDDVARKLGGT